MAKNKPAPTPRMMRCQCWENDLTELKRLSLDHKLGKAPEAFRSAVKALAEKLGAKR